MTIRKVLDKIREPWAPNRTFYWLSVLLSPFLAQKIQCRKCGETICRAFFLIFSGKACFFTKDRPRVRFCPEGPFVMSFECVGGCASLARPKIRGRDPNKENQRSILHIVLGHQDECYLAPYLSHHRNLGSQYAHLLIHGGKEVEYNQLSFKNKVFCDEKSLRGPTYYQSYSNVFRTAFNWITTKSVSPNFEWVFFSEADLWALRLDYLSPLVNAVASRDADFAGVGFDDVTCTNDTHLDRALKEGLLASAVRRATNDTNPRYFHMLGACMVFRWKAFERFCQCDHRDQNCFAEIYVPTVLASLGFVGIDLREETEAADHMRFAPPFESEEVECLASRGAIFVHPYKQVLPQALMARELNHL